MCEAIGSHQRTQPSRTRNKWRVHSHSSEASSALFFFAAGGPVGTASQDTEAGETALAGSCSRPRQCGGRRRRATDLLLPPRLLCLDSIPFLAPLLLPIILRHCVRFLGFGSDLLAKQTMARYSQRAHARLHSVVRVSVVLHYLQLSPASASGGPSAWPAASTP